MQMYVRTASVLGVEPRCHSPASKLEVHTSRRYFPLRSLQVLPACRTSQIHDESIDEKGKTHCSSHICLRRGANPVSGCSSASRSSFVDWLRERTSAHAE